LPPAGLCYPFWDLAEDIIYLVEVAEAGVGLARTCRIWSLNGGSLTLVRSTTWTPDAMGYSYSYFSNWVMGQVNVPDETFWAAPQVILSINSGVTNWTPELLQELKVDIEDFVWDL